VETGTEGTITTGGGGAAGIEAGFLVRWTEE